MSIIRSILDTDLYKFTTSYAYSKLYPRPGDSHLSSKRRSPARYKNKTFPRPLMFMRMEGGLYSIPRVSP